MRLGAEDVIHVRDRSDDGIVGRSRLSRAAGAVRTSMAIQEYSEHIYTNGARPSGVLSHPERLSKEQTDYLRTQFEALHAGTGNAGRAVVLSSGIEFKPISFSPEDSELLSSRRFATEEIARVFGVPLPLLNIWDHSSFTNSEQAQRWFSSFSLQPWCRKLELEFLRSCFTEMEDDLILEFDLSGHLRGDHAQRWAGYKIAVDAGILDVDEVRLSEGWSPREKEVNADA
jgi:HK97 family phage portal protein